MFNSKNINPGKKLNSVLRRRLIIHKVDKAKKGLSRRMTVRSLLKKMMQRNLLYQRIYIMTNLKPVSMKYTAYILLNVVASHATN